MTESIHRQCGSRVVLIIYLRWKIMFKDAPLHLQAATLTPTCSNCMLAQLDPLQSFLDVLWLI